jgi:N6-L-threonylcarbamoyladenine synthase
LRQIVIGFDSSCYTTSVAAVSLTGEIVADWRQLLTVGPGARGLRQQEALFQHWNNIPGLLHKYRSLSSVKPIAIAYSEKPTQKSRSYLPVFTAGASIAQALAAILVLPALPFTHQEGHIAAGRFGAQGPIADSFLAAHLSGGTTDFLLVHEKESGFRITRLGKTLDLNAGQLVDRVGVALDLPFPAGPWLEKLAGSCPETDTLAIPSFVQGYEVSFSGPTEAALRLVAANRNKGAIARAVFQCIANSAEKVLRKAMAETGIRDVLLVGGVAANSFIRQRLTKRLGHPAVGGRLYFTPPRLCTDNAVGIAWLGLSILGGSGK